MDQHGDSVPDASEELTRSEELSPVEHRAPYATSLRVILLLSILCWVLLVAAVLWLIHLLR